MNSMSPVKKKKKVIPNHQILTRDYFRIFEEEKRNRINAQKNSKQSIFCARVRKAMGEEMLNLRK